MLFYTIQQGKKYKKYDMIVENIVWLTEKTETMNSLNMLYIYAKCKIEYIKHSSDVEWNLHFMSKFLQLQF